MACLILTSCTEGNTTKLVTLPAASLSLIPFIGQHVSIIGYPGICFSVEQTENPCVDCEKADSIIPIAGNPVCSCTIPFLAYILTPCEGSGLPTLYTTQNLYSYVGTSITFFGQSGACYSVTGTSNIPSQVLEVIVDCAIACECIIESCGCPDGYILNDQGNCEATLIVQPIVNPISYPVSPGSTLCMPTNGQSYGAAGGVFYQDITLGNFVYPIIPTGAFANFITATTMQDSSLVPILVTNQIQNDVWGADNQTINNTPTCLGYRLNKVGIWTSTPGSPVDEWIGWTFCENIETTTTYYLGVAADDSYIVLLNGVEIIDHSSQGFAFSSWKIFPITLNAGTNTFEVRVINTVLNSKATLGFEIYGNGATLADLISVNQDIAAGPSNDINTWIIFSTKDVVGNWQTGTSSGFTCPAGYSLNTCEGNVCTQISIVPELPCFSWEITFCEGTGLDPIITSTDLTQYTGDGDVYEITYTSGPTTIVACGSVSQAPAQTAPAFIGTFSEIAYDCCEACQAVCYLLEDCQEAVPSMILCTDLKDYVGKIIKIAGCGNICWTVSQADSCVGSIKFEGEVTEFDTCLECLPPTPVPVPLELNLRKVKPGYNSPNSCVTLEYLQRVNCNFALQVYNEMLIKRYGITVCCDQDVDAWDIQKSELDYMLMGDPSLCKSTLCDCKAPCLIDVVFALVPTCVSPVIYSTIFSLDCGDPVLVSAEIEAPVIYDCLCYPVRLTVSPTTVSYYNCCCEYVSEVMTSSGNICAITTPTSLTNPINIGTVVECGSEDCGVPACNCYTVTADVGQNAQVDYINCDGSPIQLRSLPGTYSFCAIAPPTVTNATFVDNGPCISNQSCANVNDDCTCYNINITNGTGTFAYVNCSNVIQLSVIVGTGRVCAKTVPILLTPSGVQSTINIPSGVFCSGNECLPIP